MFEKAKDCDLMTMNSLMDKLLPQISKIKIFIQHLNRLLRSPVGISRVRFTEFIFPDIQIRITVHRSNSRGVEGKRKSSRRKRQKRKMIIIALVILLALILIPVAFS